MLEARSSLNIEHLHVNSAHGATGPHGFARRELVGELRIRHVMLPILGRRSLGHPVDANNGTVSVITVRPIARVCMFEGRQRNKIGCGVVSQSQKPFYDNYTMT